MLLCTMTTKSYDFVVKVLEDLYHHEHQTANDLANKSIDQKAIVGMYNLEIAEQKMEESRN